MPFAYRSSFLFLQESPKIRLSIEQAVVACSFSVESMRQSHWGLEVTSQVGRNRGKHYREASLDCHAVLGWDGGFLAKTLDIRTGSYHNRPRGKNCADLAATVVEGTCFTRLDRKFE